MNRKAVFVIVIVLSIATFTATIVVSYGALKAEAAKSDKWCYTKFNSELVCFESKNSCIDAFDLSGGAARDCHRV
jgi:hypothetical protein